MNDLNAYFYKSQRNWIRDDAPLKLCLKSRQTGFSWSNCYRLVLLVSAQDARLDAYISSRDLHQARLQLDDCRNWAALMSTGFTDLGEMLFDRDTNSSAYVLQFANGRRIYSLSSNPNALAGKRGHVTLDEFALHPDQRLLYRVAKPVTTWGGQLSIISTHRGFGSLFHQLVHDAKNGNPMGWSFHEVPIHKAVHEGIVERINIKTGRHESRAAFLQRLRAECIDQEQWNQEYCCLPADENTAFFSYEMLDACTDNSLRLLTFDELLRALAIPRPQPPTLYLGLDVARKNDLCVIDVGEKIDGVTHDLIRCELLGKSFTEIEQTLYPLLRLRQLKRACIDASGLGMQLAERARHHFGWKVEPVTLSGPRKEELAFALRHEFEDRKLRIPADEKLRADLRGLKKEVTPTGKIRFIGETEDSHCDRTWAKALRQHAARRRAVALALVA
jgi:phage FluMu gp28-like protein